jgi:UDP-N-acetylglucosamine diphosphorylase/glucosamine-1-phosphate N-acetyltransferase
MRKIYIYEDSRVSNLDPLCVTRPAFELRTGIFTNVERIRNVFKESTISLFVRDQMVAVMEEKYTQIDINPDQVEDALWLNGAAIWNKDVLERIVSKSHHLYYSKGILVAAALPAKTGLNWLKSGGPVINDDVPDYPAVELDVAVIHYLWDIIRYLPETVKLDLDANQPTGSIKGFEGVHYINPNNIYIDEDVNILPGVVLDATAGPVIIKRGVMINSFSLLKGPVVVGVDSMVASHSQINSSIIGPVCKIGGDVNQSVFQGWSNKVHNGYLGNAVIGEWVNFGAGSTNSNLKNTYQNIVMTVQGKQVDTHSLHVGSFVGDHCSFAIGTRLNTGTVIGPGSSIISSEFPPKIVPPFTWFVKGKLRQTGFAKFLETVEVMKKRRNHKLSKSEKILLERIYNDV